MRKREFFALTIGILIGILAGFCLSRTTLNGVKLTSEHSVSKMLSSERQTSRSRTTKTTSPDFFEEYSGSDQEQPNGRRPHAVPVSWPIFKEALASFISIGEQNADAKLKGLISEMGESNIDSENIDANRRALLVEFLSDHSNEFVISLVGLESTDNNKPIVAEEFTRDFIEELRSGDEIVVLAALGLLRDRFAVSDDERKLLYLTLLEHSPEEWVEVREFAQIELLKSGHRDFPQMSERFPPDPMVILAGIDKSSDSKSAAYFLELLRKGMVSYQDDDVIQVVAASPNSSFYDSFIESLQLSQDPQEISFLSRMLELRERDTLDGSGNLDDYSETDQ